MMTRHGPVVPLRDVRAVGRTSRPLSAVSRAALLVMLLPALTPGLEAQESRARGNGAQVRVVNNAGNDLSGELLGLKNESIWVLDRERGESGFVSLPLADLREVRMQRHGWSGGRIALWTGVAGGVTTVAMYSACSSVEDASDCGIFAVAWAGLWAAIGGLTRLVIGSSWASFRPAALDRLRPYARFPQGLPEGYPPRADESGPRRRSAIRKLADRAATDER